MTQRMEPGRRRHGGDGARPRLARRDAGGTARDAAAGAVVGVVAVVVSISLGSLVFSGELAALRAHGIAIALLSTLVGGIVISLLSTLPGTIGHVQDVPAAVLAAVAAGIAGALGASAAPTTLLATVVAGVALTTLVTGAAFLAMGLFRLGRLVRYLPYPVIGGFMAGTGWILVVGGIGVAIGVAPTLGALTDPGLAPRLAATLGIALAFVAVTRLVAHPMAFPVAVLVASAGFYALVAASGGDLAAWRAAGHLLGPFDAGAPFPPLAAGDLAAVEWTVVLAHAGGGATVLLLALMSGLLNATGLELGVGRRVDLDRELRAAGLGNLMTGSLGGAVVYQGLSLTMLGHRIGTGSRVVAVAALAVTASTLLLGPGLLELVPTLIVAGVLTYLGLVFVIEWVLATWRRLPWLEYAIVLTIAVTIAAAGVLTGVAVGLGLTVLLFVVTYASVDAVKHDLSGATARSRVRWEAHDRARLDRHAEALAVLQLHGFLFFGTANALVERVERRLERDPPLRSLVLDFRQVSGLDATSTASFTRLARLAQARDVTLVLAHLRPSLQHAVARAGLPPEVRVEPTLDAALEWCERDALRRDTSLVDPLLTLTERVDALTADDLELQDLIPHMHRLELPAGQRVVGPDDPPGTLYLVATGQVTARLLHEDGATRLETLRGGSLVGELGLVGAPAPAVEVTTDEATIVYRLERAALDRLAEEHPRLVAAVHRLVARRLAARVNHLEDLVAALQR